MTTKQQPEHPTFTQGEFLRIHHNTLEMLASFGPHDTRKICANICMHFWEVSPRSIDVASKVNKVFSSKNTKEIKDMAYHIYHAFLDVIGDSCAFIYSDKINQALRNSPNYYFDNGKFILKRSAEVQEAINKAKMSRYEQARTHLKEAADLLYDDNKPNYGGSMMASIKALELVVREITGENDIQKGIGSLGNKGIKLHSQFQQAIINLYRFTSDDGVRHAHPNPVQNDEETALFMLVVCSAIINFIESRLPKQDSE